MATVNFEIVNRTLNEVFSNTADNDVVFYPSSSAQSIHLGAASGATTPSLMKITGSNVEANGTLYVTSSNGIKFSDGTTQTAAYAFLGQQIGSYGAMGSTLVYLPTAAASAVTVVNNAAYTVSMISPNSITVTMNGAFVGANLPAMCIKNTWNTSVAGQVSFYAGFFDSVNTKVVGILLKNSASGITAYQSSAFYYSGNFLTSSQWTTAGGTPAGATNYTPGSGSYGVVFLMISL